MKIEFVNLQEQYLSIKKDIDTAIQSVIDQSAFISGPFTQQFENSFGKACGATYCVGVNSGTSALHIVFMSLGIGPGDEVIVPSNTFFATAEAVSLCGATPVFVDCNESYLIDKAKVDQKINKHTKAIVPVHLYGCPVAIDDFVELGRKHNIFVIEDCAQAHLAEYKGKRVGTCGIAGCFSFYPSKNLGAFGEAGAVITNNKDMYTKLLALRDHGSSKKYYHEFVGHNYRMDGLQGAILNAKLPYLLGWTEKRREIASWYNYYLSSISDITTPKEIEWAKHVYHLYVVRTTNRDKVIKKMNDNGIATGIHYPVPCHLQKAYAYLGYTKGTIKNAESFADQVISLPMYPELKKEHVEYIAKVISECF